MLYGINYKLMILVRTVVKLRQFFSGLVIFILQNEVDGVSPGKAERRGEDLDNVLNPDILFHLTINQIELTDDHILISLEYHCVQLE